MDEPHRDSGESASEAGGRAFPWRSVIGVVGLLIVIGTAIWFLQEGSSHRPSLDSGTGEPGVESISVKENKIIDQDDNSLLTSEDLPDRIAVSEEAEFGIRGAISGAALSPDGKWIALSTRGAVHGAGWLYPIGRDEVRAVAFQYGGEVRVLGWRSDGQYVAFERRTPRPSTFLTIVSPEADGKFPATTGSSVESPIPEAVVSEIAWKNGDLCFVVRERPFCVDPETNELTAQ